MSKRLNVPPNCLDSPSSRCAHWQLFELAPEGHLTTDEQGRIEEANRMAAAILEAPRRDLVGRPLQAFVCRPERWRFRSRLARLCARQAPGLQEWQVRLQPTGTRVLEAALTVGLFRDSGDSRPVLFWAVRDITRRKRVERKLQESERRYRLLYRRMLDHRNQLRILSSRVLLAKEEEARLIAHQLHDEAGQITASAHLELAELARELPSSAGGHLRQIETLLNDIEGRLRRLSHELRPTILDDLGLGPALEFLAEGIAGRTPTVIAVEGSTEGRLNPVVETAVYRIVQEALTNVARHAQAARASIRLRRRHNSLVCSVRDDGVGFDTGLLERQGRGPRGLGLLGVRERLDALGGSLQITSSPGKGTELRVTLPLRRRP